MVSNHLIIQTIKFALKVLLKLSAPLAIRGNLGSILDNAKLAPPDFQTDSLSESGVGQPQGSEGILDIYFRRLRNRGRYFKAEKCLKFYVKVSFKEKLHPLKN